jgi:hypothetical protein
MLFIQDNDVSDIYLTEYLRIFNHHYFKKNQKNENEKWFLKFYENTELIFERKMYSLDLY